VHFKTYADRVLEIQTRSEPADFDQSDRTSSEAERVLGSETRSDSISRGESDRTALEGEQILGSQTRAEPADSSSASEAEPVLGTKLY